MPLVVNHLYEFDKFRVNADRGVLLRGDDSVPLTAKAFEILLVLIRHRNETVSKDALLKTVWPDTFVEEANLTQHISMLRKALGEARQDRRYIATVPGRGYRFVAEVREFSEGKIPDEGSIEETIVVESHSRSQIVIQESKTGGIVATVSSWAARIDMKIRTVVASAMVVLLIVALVVTRGRLRAPAPLSEKDSIFLADFENSTGEPVFDGALKEGMAVELGQSPFLDLASTDRVRETLQFMGRSPGERLQLPLARELCERMGSKALISGSIARLGSTYVIAVEALGCADGTALAREQVEANSKEEVLPLLGKVAARLRAKLGESLNSIQKFDVPVQQATTSSLEALKAYSLGVEQRDESAEKDAIPLFVHAIELDPQFAMAYAQLGAAYNNLGETERASDSFERAFRLRDNLSEREKLYLTARYYDTVTGDIEKATETYETWSRLYPRDPRPFNGLSARYQIVGQYEKAAAAAREALRLQPTRYVPYANLASSYLALNRFDGAKEVCLQANAARRDSLYTHRVLFEIALLNHDQPAMQHEVDWSAGRDRENDMLNTQGNALAASGKLQAARQIFDRSWSSSQRNGLNDDAASSMAGEALIEADFGNYERASTQAMTALKLGHGIDAMEMAAEALALAGNADQSRAVAEELGKRFPRHTALNSASLPATFAAIELRHGNPTRAVDILQKALPYDLSEFSDLSPIYVRGQAYLHARSGKEAAAEFQKILDHSGIDATSPRHALAHLGLARAFALTGDTAKSRKAYEDFFALWSGGDSDIPELRQAKLEYQKLK
jgi:DNA-binding winged helix-turn-helix (wHTH) protein/tetratricopeptide (TPR) repeat protein